MPPLIDRRTLLAAPCFVRRLISAPPSGQLRLGAFGAGGMAFVTSTSATQTSFTLGWRRALW